MLYVVQMFNADGTDVGALMNVRKSNVQFELKTFVRNNPGIIHQPEFGVIYSGREFQLLAAQGRATTEAICGVFRRTPNRCGFSVTLAGQMVRG